MNEDEAIWSRKIKFNGSWMLSRFRRRSLIISFEGVISDFVNVLGQCLKPCMQIKLYATFWKHIRLLDLHYWLFNLMYVFIFVLMQVILFMIKRNKKISTPIEMINQDQ